MKYRYPALLFASFIAFLFLYNPADLYFLSDDFDSVLKVRSTSYILHSFRPLSDLSLKVDNLLWGNNATGYFFTNILLHLLSTSVLYLFTKQLCLAVYNQIDSKRNAFFVAILFLFYPYHSEPLFWIVGRGATLCTLMALLSLFFYLKKQENIGYYFLSLLFFIAGALSYEAIWILPLIIIIISIVLAEKKMRSKEAVYILGFWCAFLIYLVIRFYLTKEIIGSPYGSAAVISSTTFFIKIKNYVALLSRSFLPPAKESFLYIIYFLGLATCLGFTFYKLIRRWNRILNISIPSFLVCLLPAISFGIDTHDTEGERFLYLPSVFLAISVVIILSTLLKNKAVPVFCILVIAEGGFLFYNYQSFKTAGSITKETVKQFSSLKNIDNLICINLPSQFRGAYIFRNGFESAIKLYAGV
ncbi:MAG: hypothetical protein ABI168_07045, partial [Ginsengibacter sp.]